MSKEDKDYLQEELNENETLQNTYLGLIHLSKAWYAESSLKEQDFIDEVLFGIYYFDGGCVAEASIKWYQLTNSHCSPKLEMFDDAFQLFNSLPTLFQTINNLPNDFSPNDFIDHLLTLGFEDKTPLQME